HRGPRRPRHRGAGAGRVLGRREPPRSANRRPRHWLRRLEPARASARHRPRTAEVRTGAGHPPDPCPRRRGRVLLLRRRHRRAPRHAPRRRTRRQQPLDSQVVALKKLFKNLRTPVNELDLERLRKFCESRQGVTSIAGLPARVEGTVVGEITSMRIVPRAGSPSLEATITDGSGSLVVVWTGRRKI